MKSNDPTRNLGFLIHEISRLLRRNFARRVADLGLTPAQWRTLAYLARNEGVNQVTLAEMLEVRPITLARLIDRLEEAGWVERRRDPDDRRATRLYLTGAAQPVIDELELAGIETRKDTLAGLTKAEQGRALDLLCMMKTNLMKAEADAPPAPQHDDLNDDE